MTLRTRLTRLIPFLGVLLFLALMLLVMSQSPQKVEAASSASAASLFNSPGKHLVDGQFNGARAVVSADLDGDNDLDVVGAGSQVGHISWWRNNGDGTTSTEQIIDPQFEGAWDVSVADVDGDNDLDVIAGAYLGSQVVWWQNNGDGSSWIRYVVAFNVEGAWSVIAVDVDGDNDLDIVGPSVYSNDLFWWENNGDLENWTSHVVASDFQAPQDVNAADIDDDGDQDLVTADSITDDITWWENQENGTTWVEHLVDGTFNGAHAVVPVDMDGDNDLDLVGAAKEADEIAWWENDGTPLNGGWRKYLITDQFDGPFDVIAADFNADGYPEIVGGAYQADELKLWQTLSSRTDDNWIEYTIDNDFDARSVAVGDMDGDSDLDILSASTDQNQIAWWESPPILDGMTPDSAVANAGNIAIIISGQNLTGSVSARIGNIDLSGVTLVNTTTIHAVLPIEQLSEGTHDLTFTSGQHTITLPNAFTVKPPVPKTQFRAMVYLACDNNLASSCKRLFNNLELAMMNNSDLRIVAFWDGNKDGDSAYYLVQPDDNPYAWATYDESNRVQLGEVDSADPETLVAFASWARSQYPGHYSLISLVDHGSGWTPTPNLAGGSPYVWGGSPYVWGGGMFWDDQANNVMPTRKMSEALGWITRADKTDVIYLDACFMSGVEVMSELSSSAHYLVGQENYTWAVYPYDQYLNDIDGSTTPEDLAKQITEINNASLPAEGHPAQVGAIKTSQMDNLLGKVDALASSLLDQLSNDTVKQAIREAALASAHVDENGDWSLNGTDRNIDLYDFAKQLNEHENMPIEIKNAAQEVMNTQSSVMEVNYSTSGTPWPGFEHWDLSNLNGLSLYFPIEDEWRRRFYHDYSLPTFAGQTHWDEFVQAWFDGINPPEIPEQPCFECIPVPKHIGLTIDEVDSSAAVDEPVWVPVSLHDVDMADDVRGVQISVRVTETDILQPSNDLMPRLGELFASESFTYSVKASTGWDFFLTAPLAPAEAISGTGVVVELPFYFTEEGCADLVFDDHIDGHILMDSTPDYVNHQEVGQTICSKTSTGRVVGEVYLESRTPGHYGEVKVLLQGASGTYSTTTNADGKYTLDDVLPDTYTMTVTHVASQALFVKRVVNDVVVTPTVKTMPDIGLWAGDIDQDDDVDQRDWDLLKAAIIPVGHPLFDINADGTTNVGDSIILVRNLNRAGMMTSNPPRIARRGFTAKTIPSLIEGLTEQKAAQRVAIPLPVESDEEIVAILRAIDLNSGEQVTSAGTQITLPAGVNVTGVELTNELANGFLSWQQKGNTLYLVVAPHEQQIIRQDTDLLRVYMKTPDATNALRLEVSQANMVGWQGKLILRPLFENLLSVPVNE